MKPRVTLVVPTFPKLSETFIISHFTGLLARGWDAYVVCAEIDERALHSAPDLHDHSHRIFAQWKRGKVFSPPSNASKILRQALASSRAREKLAAERRLRGVKRLVLDAPFHLLAPDLVHFEFGTLARVRPYLGSAIGAKTITSFRGYDLNSMGLDDPTYYASVWKEIDGIHVLGEDLWRQARARGCPAGKLHATIPPALNHVPGEARPRSAARRPILLSVGRLDWKKGYEYALGAARQLADTGIDFEYRIVGDGSYRRLIEHEIQALGLQSSVTLVGALPHAGVWHELAAADVFLHLAVSEGFCNAVIEAQAAGVPVVVSDAGGLPENVAHGVSGFVVPRRDPTAASQRLAELLGAPAARLEMGRRARERALALYGRDRQLDAFEAFYETVLTS